jgi:isopenicillin N synthase-like dioxygenase
VDDSRSLPPGTDIEHAECAVSMSPHRLCRYSNNDASNGKQKKINDPTREVFGAHTDSSFVTAVPVAAVAGLEVYDEAEEQWYRPEKAVRKHWQSEQVAAGKDPEALTETTDDGVELPWHSRYVVMIPGELLQLATRNEVPAAVHRVVATEGNISRLSAPILFRGRPGMTLDIGRYLGSTGGDPLLEECSGMTIEQIHDSMQAPPQ